MKSYGQYCPIARTSEFFAERWTPIIIRNLGTGCRTFTQLREGAPGIPKAILAERLALLERYGVVDKSPRPTGRGYTYELTASGRELKQVCDVMGEWGARWLEIEPRHIDPAYVIWATCRSVDLGAVPKSGVVIRFDLSDAPRTRYWMVLLRPRAEVCTSFPGRDEDLVVTTDSATLTEWNLRRIGFQEALRSGRCRIDGSPGLARRFPTWLRPSPFAKAMARSRYGTRPQPRATTQRA